MNTEKLETTEIVRKVTDIISEQLGTSESEIQLSSHYLNDLGADSLDIVELVMAFEDAFDIKIPDDEAEKLKTVGETVTYIEKVLAKN